MRFADLGMTLAAVLLAVWVGALAGLAAWQRRRSPASPGGLRPVLVGAGVCAVLLGAHVAVIDAIEDRSTLARLDQPVLTDLVQHRDTVANTLMAAVSAAGGTLGMTVLATVAAAVLLCRRLPAEAAVVAVTGLGASALVTGFKHLRAAHRRAAHSAGPTRRPHPLQGCTSPRWSRDIGDSLAAGTGSPAAAGPGPGTARAGPPDS